MNAILLDRIYLETLGGIYQETAVEISEYNSRRKAATGISESPREYFLRIP